MLAYQPPFQITPAMLDLVAEISERLGRWHVVLGESGEGLSLQARRSHRIKAIQSSLAIEDNSLSIEQVTAALDGRRVVCSPKELLEARNTYHAYDSLPLWQPYNVQHLLAAHSLLMNGLVDNAGHWRQTGVGIYRGEQLLHMAPPPRQVPQLMTDLLFWLKQSPVHPLIASSVFHYELEFIHPFSDGNGRIGRLWQTLILSRWRPVLAYLPTEVVIHRQQNQFYGALSTADQANDASIFVELMLQAVLSAMQYWPI